MTDSLKSTPLADLHRELGARMVPFAGYEMPVQYPTGIISEHLHTREHAGLFDVSHMGQFSVSGPGVTEALETLLPLDLQNLAKGAHCYGLLTNEEGGIRDDLIITRRSQDHFDLVVNAACKDADFAYLCSMLSNDITLIRHDHLALLALQGPEAAAVIKELAPAAVHRGFMAGVETELQGIPCYISRTGYTGEDGFEISVDGKQAETLARMMLADPRVKPIGLGARDSLRLEAGLCLYGHDMNETTTPAQSSLGWAIAKIRRVGGEREGRFPGSDIILAEMQAGAESRRVGFLVEGRVPVREGAPIYLADKQVGQVTSGGFAPSLQRSVVMARVKVDALNAGQALTAEVRGKRIGLEAAKLPFVAHRYYRGE